MTDSRSAELDRTIAVIHDLLADWSDGPPEHWENASVPRYLEALAARLGSCDGFYANQGEPVPWNGWEVLREAIQAAAIYE